MVKLKILGLEDVELFAQGHGACSGCGAALAMRLILKAAGKNTIVSLGTGCMEVISTPYPETAWRVPVIHSAFENVASTASGVEAALRKLGRNEKVVCIAGDGGTFDIGFGALSGMIERGHDITYICYENASYANTGFQRSGATPRYGETSTTPYGKKIHGKQEVKKPLPFIIAAHRSPYVATANVAFPQDLDKKIRKAISTKGPTYVQVFSPCILGWKYPTGKTIEIARKSVESGIAPLYEIINGKLILKDIKKIKVGEFLSLQGRFKHLSKSEISEIQRSVDEEWKFLKSGVRFY